MKEGPPVPKRSPEGKKGMESPELFRASLGFDFIFFNDEKGVKHALCVEINGEDSGIAGVGEIPKGEIPSTQRTLANIRDSRNLERLKKVREGTQVVDDLKTGEFSASGDAQKKIKEYLSRSVLKRPLLIHAFHNPPFIQDITYDKEIQQELIPEESRPRMYVKGESPISSTGYWICKPKAGSGGRGIQILSNNEFEQAFVRKDNVQELFIAQEFIPSAGADKAPKKLKGNAASMRLLMDFRYRADGTIEAIFEAAYQRISPYSEDDRIRRPDGTGIFLEDINVVNQGRGARSAPASPEELALARPIAEQVIRNIAEAYKRQVKK